MHNILMLVSWIIIMPNGSSEQELTADELLRLSLPAFSRVVWECMPILGSWLEAEDRILFSEVGLLLSLLF